MFGCSALFHIYLSKSHELLTRFAICDYIGIICMMMGGYTSLILIAKLSIAYIIIHIALASYCVYKIIYDNLLTPRHISQRLCLFGSLFTTVLVPFINIIVFLESSCRLQFFV